MSGVDELITTEPGPQSSLIATQQQRPPLYRNTTVIKWTLQLVTLALVIFAGWFFATEAGSNLAEKGVKFDFDFININQGFDVSFTVDRNPDTGGRALWVGMINTIRLAAAGIFFSTIIGIIVGVSRLSKNWIANRVAGVYIETLRNIPLLVQIFVWLAVFQTLGRLSAESGPYDGWLYASARGLSIPRVFISDGFYQWMIFVLIGCALAWLVFRNRVAARDRSGSNTLAGPLALLTVVMAAVIGWFAHPVFGFVGGIFQALSDAWQNIPQFALQVAFTAVALVAAALWIKRFLDSRRTPAGLAKLTDDDYFRMIFAALAGIFAAFVILVMWPGMSSWVINSGSDFWQVAADKFGTNGFGVERTGPPIEAARPSLVPNENNEKIVQYGLQGLTLPIEFMSIFAALTLYTGAFIAEIVRGGINAVAKGQSEAADSLGLSRMQSLRHIILPQAFRVSLPPLGNQYLNLTKNTSLAIAALYTDVYLVGNTVINQSGRVLSVFIIWMVFYLTLSLLTSLVVNFFNVRLAIVER